MFCILITLKNLISFLVGRLKNSTWKIMKLSLESITKSKPSVHKGHKKRDMEDFHHIISDTSYSVCQIYLILTLPRN